VSASTAQNRLEGRRQPGCDGERTGGEEAEDQ
jgi:hypothetical protein